MISIVMARRKWTYNTVQYLLVVRDLHSAYDGRGPAGGDDGADL
jgi:hypothetical protein